MKVEQQKVVGYLLNREKSRGKAGFFTSMGFEVRNWHVLAAALEDQALSGTVSDTVESKYGTRYVVEGPIETPDGRLPRPIIRTVWVEEHGSSEWRLITAYPLKGGQANDQ